MDKLTTKDIKSFKDTLKSLFMELENTTSHKAFHNYLSEHYNNLLDITDMVEEIKEYLEEELNKK